MKTCRSIWLAGIYIALAALQSCTQPAMPCETYIASALKLSMRNGLVYVFDTPFTGRIYDVYPGGMDTMSATEFLNGKEHGLWCRYYEDGKLAEKRAFDNGKKTGVYEAWYPDGKLRLQYNFADGEYEGCCREWFANGQLMKEMHYSAGHENGAQKLFYENGKIRSNYEVRNGRRFGLLGTKNCSNPKEKLLGL